MVYVVFIKEHLIGFVSQELTALFEYMSKHRFHKVEIWNGNRHVGGTWG